MRFFVAFLVALALAALHAGWVMLLLGAAAHAFEAPALAIGFNQSILVVALLGMVRELLSGGGR